ncbi:plastocyanin/azurin family copper-binding protein [Conexibacter sp. SYSU D00693]|uniref:cupredoxin domain-containing protein n=1 Tax=Conexibacter sp. SYSU D00693 TaxID=2812560 RepID=UPI00196B0BE1|nr:plastocyanin/azurin family copper-binding protein [Conexibacter sp. SYSU D00693]
MRTTAAVLAALALAATAAGCGDDDGGDVATSPASPSQTSKGGEAPLEEGTVRVGMRNLRFDPEEVTVAEGQTIRWVNDESIQHNVVAEEGADFKSELIDEGGTYEFTPEQTGTIQYVCTLHPGMDGTIEVTAEGS